MTLALSRPIALALLLLGTAVPAGLLAPGVGADGCANGEFGVTEHIKSSGPLSESPTATELVHHVAETTDRGSLATYHVNGLDAYAYEMGCVANEKALQYRLADRTPTEVQDADYALAFYTEDFRKIDDTVYDKEAEEAHGQLAGYVPDQTYYVVVILEDGPLFAGMDHERFPPEPYAATFELTLTSNH